MNIKTKLPVLGCLLGATIAQASTDYGPATWKANCGQYYTSGNGHKFAVIHDIEGYYLSTISYFQNCGTTASIHYLVNGKHDTSTDAAAGDITQMVRDSNYAWHVKCWNTHSAGTEHEGFASNPAWFTAALYDASADLQKHFASIYGLAKDRNHIVGHNEWQNSAWRTYAANNLGIDPNCNSHTDPGSFWDWTGFMALINNTTGSANPPYMFDAGVEGWSAANGWAGGLMWTDAGGWSGVIYQDQTDTNPYFTGPNCTYPATSPTGCINVSVYPQGGTTANHELQFYWKTTGEDFFDGTKSSPLVNYVKQDNWIRLNLETGASGKWAGQTITKFRVDFDDKPFGVRFIVGHVINQATPIYTFDTTAQSWTVGSGLGAINQESCCGWPGVIWADQTGVNPYFVSPAFSGFYGGANDLVQVRFYAQNGTNATHDAQVYWQTTSDATWGGVKSTSIVNWSGNNQYVTVNFPVGANSNWATSQITKLRVDVDDKPTGIRWMIDSVKIVHP